jgi:hypothetical protein
VTDPEEVDLKKTDQILTTVSDRAGQTFELDMEESGAPNKKRKRICLRRQCKITVCHFRLMMNAEDIEKNLINIT